LIPGICPAGEEKGEKEIAYLCQPPFFMQGFFSGIYNQGLTLFPSIIKYGVRTQ